jgi:hypothetical protein
MFTYNYSNKELKMIAVSLLSMYCATSLAKTSVSESKINFSIVSDFAKTKNDIRIKDKTFTFQTGSIGIQAAFSSDQYGELFVKYGLGHSSSESATFAAAEVSGPIDIKSFGYGYVYPYAIPNSDFGLDFRISKTSNNHDGEGFSGFRYDEPVTASIDATSSFTRGSIALNYQVNEDVELTAGVGVHDWDISAKAKGSFVDSSGIRFSTDTEANGTDRFHYLEASFPMMDRTMNLGIRRSNLNTDTQNVLREIYASITLVLD